MSMLCHYNGKQGRAWQQTVVQISRYCILVERLRETVTLVRIFGEYRNRYAIFSGKENIFKIG
jgi:hypothetical protein